MSRFGTILTTKSLVKRHLIEARIRIERKDLVAAVPHLLAAVEAQQTALNCLADLLNRPRERKIVPARRPAPRKSCPDCHGGLEALCEMCGGRGYLPAVRS